MVNADEILVLDKGLVVDRGKHETLLARGRFYAKVAAQQQTSEVFKTSEVYFLEAQTRAAEARAALRWIKARIVRAGLKLPDAAVLLAVGRYLSDGQITP